MLDLLSTQNKLHARLVDFKHSHFDGLLITEYARRKNL